MVTSKLSKHDKMMIEMDNARKELARVEFSIHVPCHCKCGCKETTSLGQWLCSLCSSGIHNGKEGDKEK